MRLLILESAIGDLMNGYRFYESQDCGLGSYFLDSLFSDIDSLLIFAGVHSLHFGKHRLLARRFPFAVYYTIQGETVIVHAVVDCRRDPVRIARRML